MLRFSGKILILLAIMLVFANAGCLTRCIVQSCEDNPPPCHSHGTQDTGHCPQQNQMKTAVTSTPPLDWGGGFVLVNGPLEVTHVEQAYSSSASTVIPPSIVPVPSALRI